MHDVQLTTNFWLSEFLESKVMPELAAYTPNLQELANVTRLAGHLQVIRNYVGRPVQITGGGRPDSVRRQSDGATFWDVLTEAGYPASKTSQHASFCAADFIVIGADLKAVFQYACKQFMRDYTQIILYLRDGGLTPGMIHFGIHDFFAPQKGKKNARLIHVNGSYRPA